MGNMLKLHKQCSNIHMCYFKTLKTWFTSFLCPYTILLWIWKDRLPETVKWQRLRNLAWLFLKKKTYKLNTEIILDSSYICLSDIWKFCFYYVTMHSVLKFEREIIESLKLFIKKSFLGKLIEILTLDYITYNL